MSPENTFNSNNIENPKEIQGNETKKESSVLRNFLVGSVVAGAAMAPTLSEAQSYDTGSTQDIDIARRAEVKRSNNEYHKLDIEKINKELKAKYPEANFEYGSHGKCLNSFGGDVFYKGVMIGHVENNCGAGNGAILASGQSMKMLDNYLSRIGGAMVIKTSVEVEEKLKALKVNINGLKVQIFENRGGKIVWSNFEFDANTLSVDIVNNQKHPKGISIIMKNKDGTSDTVDIYPDSTGTANIVEGL
jgi:hypothetical protein